MVGKGIVTVKMWAWALALVNRLVGHSCVGSLPLGGQVGTWNWLNKCSCSLSWYSLHCKPCLHPCSGLQGVACVVLCHLLFASHFPRCCWPEMFVSCFFLLFWPARRCFPGVVGSCYLPLLFCLTRCWLLGALSAVACKGKVCKIGCPGACVAQHLWMRGREDVKDVFVPSLHLFKMVRLLHIKPSPQNCVVWNQ